MLEGELGEKLDDRSLVLELTRRCLGGELVDDETHDRAADSEVRDEVCNGDGKPRESAKPTTRPLHTVHILKCPDCRRAWQQGAGAAIEISANALERIECDAVIVHEENGETAAWSIPPATRRKVMARDHGCCQVPGCRAARFLDVHHIIHRALGGTNDEWNLIVLCAGHHRLHHDGLLGIVGRAPDQVRFIRDGVLLLSAAQMPAHTQLLGAKRDAVPVAVRAPANQNSELAKLALTTMGFKASIARHAVEAARAREGTDTLEALIKEALRHCS